jgi:hypothetical protein
VRGVPLAVTERVRTRRLILAPQIAVKRRPIQAFCGLNCDNSSQVRALCLACSAQTCSRPSIEYWLGAMDAAG